MNLLPTGALERVPGWLGEEPEGLPDWLGEDPHGAGVARGEKLTGAGVGMLRGGGVLGRAWGNGGPVTTWGICEAWTGGIEAIPTPPKGELKAGLRGAGVGWAPGERRIPGGTGVGENPAAAAGATDSCRAALHAWQRTESGGFSCSHEGQMTARVLRSGWGMASVGEKDAKMGCHARSKSGGARQIAASLPPQSRPVTITAPR